MAEPYDTLTTSPVTTPQTEPVPGREAEQVANAAGGYTFAITPWQRLDRFLILGTSAGTYYQEPRDLTKENVDAIRECLHEDGPRVVGTALLVNLENRAPRVDPSLYVLAMAMTPTFADVETRQAAAQALPEMLRTFTHVAMFCKYLSSLRGWGEIPRRAVRAFYENKSPAALAYQGIKYPQREGWTHKDVLRTVHPKAPTPEHAEVYDWMVRGRKSVALRDHGVVLHDESLTHSPRDDWSEHMKLIWAYETAQATVRDGEAIKESESRLLSLIDQHKLPWEAVPMVWRGEPKVWSAALANMPPTATLRNLGQLTSMGVIGSPLEPNTKLVVARLGAKEQMRGARVHPFAVYQAMMVYRHGKGIRGGNTWEPVAPILDALDLAFYDSFGNVEPTGKNILVAIDTSSSMGANWGSFSPLASFPGASVRDLAAAFAMVVARSESAYDVVGFDHRLRVLPISPKQRLDDVIRAVPADGGSTDASLPMQYAIQGGLDVDAFVVITDNESWSGDRHPFQALQAYRRAFNKAAKLVVVGMTASRGSIGDQADSGTLDVVGFDATAPSVIADFIRGS